MSNKELVYTKSSTEKLRKFLNYMPKLKLEDAIRSHVKY